MTMQHHDHPDDERLAALAGGDPDATADAGLRAHVSGCDRCGSMVADLGALQSALAELPDLVPSRSIQLVPPVAAPRESGRDGWLRRLAAPMLAGGAGLALVGVIGTTGMLSSLGGLGGAMSAAAPSDTRSASGAGAPEGQDSHASNTPPQPQTSREGEYGANSQVPTTVDLSGSQAASPKAMGSRTPAAYGGGVTPEDTGRGSISPWPFMVLLGALLAFAGGTILAVQPTRGP
jgi:hypothetical protein